MFTQFCLLVDQSPDFFYLSLQICGVLRLRGLGYVYCKFGNGYNNNLFDLLGSLQERRCSSRGRGSDTQDPYYTDQPQCQKLGKGYVVILVDNYQSNKQVSKSSRELLDTFLHQREMPTKQSLCNFKN